MPNPATGMESVNPVYGDDAVLQINDGAANAFAAIPDVIDVTPPGAERPHVERKRLDNAGYMEMSPGNRPTFGEITITYEMKGGLFLRFDKLQFPTALYTPGGADPRVKTLKVMYPDGLLQTVNFTVKSNKPNKVDAGAISTATLVLVVQGPTTNSFTASTSIPVIPDAYVP